MFAGQCLTGIQGFCFFLACLMGELLCSSVLILKACKRCPLPLLGEPPRLGHYREYPHAGKQLWGTTSVNSSATNCTRELSRRPWWMSWTAEFPESTWCDSVLPSWLWKSRFPCRLGSLGRNDDGNGNENDKKKKKLNRFFWQNNNSARASRCLVHFSAVVARLQREST